MTVAMPAGLFPDDHPVRLYLESLAEGSRPTQWSALLRIVKVMSRRKAEIRYFDWSSVTYADVVRLRRHLTENLKPATGNRYLSAFRGVMETTWQIGLISAETRDRLTHRRVLKPIRGESVPPGRALSRAEITAIFVTCAADYTHAGPRDGAMFAILAGCGLRANELVTLRTTDIDLDAASVMVAGKGNKERRVPMPTGTVAAVRVWLDARGSKPGPLFLSLSGTGGEAEGAVSRWAATRILQKRAARAGVDNVTLHDFRRTYISNLLDDELGLEVVARLVGHQNPATTARYDRRGDARARKAADGIDVPYREPVLKPRGKLEGDEDV